MPDTAKNELTHCNTQTGLPNRVRLRQLFAQAIVHCGGENRPLALLMLSIGHLHEIEQILGYQEGEKLIQGVARRIRGELLSADVVGLMGEDDFAIVLPGRHAERATDIAKVLPGALTPPVDLSGLLKRGCAISGAPSNPSRRAPRAASHSSRVRGLDSCL
jgi:diguanylate cyclase (GGDEF)-like protein